MATAPSPCVVERQRREHVQRAEEERGHGHQPEPEQEVAVADRRHDQSERLALGRRRLQTQCGDQEHDLEGRDGGERPADADHARGRADHRAEQRAEDGGAHRRAHRLAATLARGGEREPGEPACPGQRRAEALGEPRRDERPVTPGRGDTDTARGDEDEPREDGAPRAAARGDDAAGNRAGQDAEAVRGHERTDAALGEVVRLLEMGQQRCERRVQSGVDDDDDADEGEQPAHRPRLPGRCGPLPCADRGRSGRLSIATTRL